MVVTVVVLLVGIGTLAAAVASFTSDQGLPFGIDLTGPYGVRAGQPFQLTGDTRGGHASRELLLEAHAAYPPLLPFVVVRAIHQQPNHTFRISLTQRNATYYRVIVARDHEIQSPEVVVVTPPNAPQPQEP
jgi:hypothetical protein